MGKRVRGRRMVKIVSTKCDWLNQGMMTLIFKVWKTKETYSPLSGDFDCIPVSCPSTLSDQILQT